MIEENQISRLLQPHIRELNCFDRKKDTKMALYRSLYDHEPVIVKEVSENGLVDSKKSLFSEYNFVKAARDKKLSHIIKIFDVCVTKPIEKEEDFTGCTLVTVMEEGGNSLDKLDRNKTSQGDIARYLYEAALGIQQMHNLGWAHRDIKPGNIVLVPVSDPVRHDVAKLIDFDKVRKYDRNSTELIRTECEAVGTKAYVSPEQFAKGDYESFEEKYFGCYDTWSMAIVMLEYIFKLTTDVTIQLFKEKEDTKERVKKRLLLRFPKKQRVLSDIEMEMLDVISSCLAYKVSERNTSMEPIIKVLRRYMLVIGGGKLPKEEIPQPETLPLKDYIRTFEMAKTPFPFYFRTDLGIIRNRTISILGGNLTDGLLVEYKVDGLTKKKCNIVERDITSLQAFQKREEEVRWQHPKFVRIVERLQKVGGPDSPYTSYLTVFEAWSDTATPYELRNSTLPIHVQIRSLKDKFHVNGSCLGSSNLTKTPLMQEGLLLRPKFKFLDQLTPTQEAAKKENDNNCFNEQAGNEFVMKQKDIKSTGGNITSNSRMVFDKAMPLRDRLEQKKDIEALQDFPELCESITSIKAHPNDGPILVEARLVSNQKIDSCKVTALTYTVSYRYHRSILKNLRLCIYSNIDEDVKDQFSKAILQEVKMGKMLLGRYSHFLRYYGCDYIKTTKRAYVLTEPYKHLDQLHRRSKKDFPKCFTSLIEASSNKEECLQQCKHLWWTYRQLGEVFVELQAGIEGRIKRREESTRLTKILLKQSINDIKRDMKKLMCYENLVHGFISPFSLVFVTKEGTPNFQLKLAGLQMLVSPSKKPLDSVNKKLKQHDYLQIFHDKLFARTFQQETVWKDSLRPMDDWRNRYQFSKRLLKMYYTLMTINGESFSVIVRNKAPPKQQVPNKKEQISQQKIQKLEEVELWQNVLSALNLVTGDYRIVGDIYRAMESRKIYFEKGADATADIKEMRMLFAELFKELPGDRRVAPLSVISKLYRVFNRHYYALLDQLSKIKDQQPVLGLGCGMQELISKKCLLEDHGMQEKYNRTTEAQVLLVQELLEMCTDKPSCERLKQCFGQLHKRISSKKK